MPTFCDRTESLSKEYETDTWDESQKVQNGSQRLSLKIPGLQAINLILEAIRHYETE